MAENIDYARDINQLKDEAIDDLEGLLKFAKNKLYSTANFNHFSVVSKPSTIHA